MENKMTKVKIGDKVKILSTDTSWLEETIGRVGIVEEVCEDETLLIDVGVVSGEQLTSW